MKFIRLSFLILGLASILWLILPHDKLPSISLPKGAQHNMFGELPIVEMADDGNFYEKDGDEYNHKSKWCDEAQGGFTCMLKFGQTLEVARRIANNIKLDSCEVSREQQRDYLDFCFQQCNNIRALPDSINFYIDYYQDCSERCTQETKYTPECDGEYTDWLGKQKNAVIAPEKLHEHFSGIQRIR